jgi:protocatechuate 3,4-dioxygenase beta subunit
MRRACTVEKEPREMTHDTHDRGLEHDLMTFAYRATGRRDVLCWALGAVATTLVGCGAESANNSIASGNDGGNGGPCSTIPEETAGPFPGDGTNGANALSVSGIVRGDIRSSVGSAAGVAAGIPLMIKLTIVDTAAACAPVGGYAVYLWHCDRDGNYSMYSAAVANENYLRGVQETGADGTVTFTTIFPGCYSGRWPHVHFEVYPSAAVATSGMNKVATSQLALPKDSCDEVYASAGYEASVTNLAAISLERDNVFSDGVSLQLASVTGSVESGFVASLTVSI